MTGVHSKGTACLKTYDEAKQVWSDHPQAILSGSEQKPWISNAYWNHPVTGTDGSLHVSFVWRIQGMGDENVVNNTNIGYACSFDNGNTWQTSHDHPYKLPITQVNAETVYPVTPASNLINQYSMALDSVNCPHIVFYADDANGIPQYQHLRFDRKVWHHAIVSQRAADFELLGAGTLQIPISRPEIVLDAQDNAYLIYRGGDLSKDRMTATMLYSHHIMFFTLQTRAYCLNRTWALLNPASTAAAGTKNTLSPYYCNTTSNPIMNRFLGRCSTQSALSTYAFTDVNNEKETR